jgi:hypothetical protein
MPHCLRPTAAWLIALGLLSAKAPAADVSVYTLVKTEFHAQSNSSAPVLLSTNACNFTAAVLPSAPDLVSNATVTPPGQPVRTLVSDPGGTSLRYDFTTNTQAQLDALFPKTGSYSVAMQTAHDGLKQATLSFTVFGFPLAFPPLVQVGGFDEAQNIDQTLDFTLRWTIPGGTSLQLVQCLVLDAASNIVFSTPFPFSVGALNGTSNSARITAYSLPPGASLTGHLIIAQPALPNTTDYAGATGVAALAKDTAFPMRTRPAPPPPLLTVLPRTNSLFRLHLAGEPNRSYQIQGTGAFDGWTNLFTTNSVSGSFDFSDPASPGLAQRFYRARVGD